MTRATLLLTCLLSLSATPVLADKGHSHAGHSGHDHAAFAAGEPGDPKRAARIVPVAMKELQDGSMAFFPETLAVRKGEQVRFVLTNSGKADHEFVLATVAENAEHKAAMAKSPGMAHDDPNAKRLAPGKVSEILWRFTKQGTFEFACLLPGHYEAGMKGTVTVK